MNIRYAQASYQEANASNHLAATANVKEHLTVSLPFYKDIQSRYHPKQSRSITTAYVPARNTIFYGIAAAYAEALELDTVIFGSNADDARELPDARPSFIQLMNELIRAGTRAGQEGSGPVIVNNLIHHSKIEVLRLALKLKVPLELTWSCYTDAPVPCGTCRGCTTRRKAFEAVGVADPLLRPSRVG